MARIRHDDEGMTYACPECDHAGDIYHRAGNGNAYAGDPDAPFVCHHCSATFTKPKEREARSWQREGGSSAGQNGIGKIMAEMTVEEFDAIVNGGESA